MTTIVDDAKRLRIAILGLWLHLARALRPRHPRHWPTRALAASLDDLATRALDEADQLYAELQQDHVRLAAPRHGHPRTSSSASPTHSDP